MYLLSSPLLKHFPQSLTPAHVPLGGLRGSHGGGRLFRNGRSSNLLPKNDISDFAGRQRSDVDAVPLPEVGQNEILQSHFDLDPVVIAQRRPHEVGLGDGRLVRPQDDLCFLVIDVQTTKQEYQTGERREAWN